jgi:hypothetical protein
MAKKGTKKSTFTRMLPRMRRPSARIPLGLAVVALSVGGVWWVVDDMNTFEPYLVTQGDVVSGTALKDIVFEEILLSSPGRELGVLRPGDELVDPHRIVTADLPAGSFLSQEQLRVAPPADSTTFTTTLDIGGAPWLVRGAHVEVWVAAPLSDQSFSVPVVVAPQSVVVGVRMDEGFAADSTRVTVDLQVNRREIPSLIHAQANDYSIQVSPVVSGPQ